ncbi:MAG: 30S ribosomal protein S7 [Candidatus Ancaeobacter aquaticus]|nr:30S ribosomal protein S7 [Candidatus Ancaeobacter aquaticus]
MARRRRATKRKVIPDSKFKNVLVAKFINMLMVDGEKSIAEKIFYSSLDTVQEQTKEQEPVKVFLKAIDNVKPLLEVKSRRIGGATYQVPIEVSPDRRVTLAIKWIITYSRARKGQPMGKRLATEIIDAYKGVGSSIKKREDTHKMAEANKAFAHYKW